MTPLQNCVNTILTPHIGGSTEEAQRSIGVEVATTLVKFMETGSTMTAVNLPEVELKATKAMRIINYHKNVPGVLKQINKVLSEYNIVKQVCESRGMVSFLVADLQVQGQEGVKEGVEKGMQSIMESISTRVIYK